MAITFPLALSQFSTRLKVADCQWRLMDFVEVSGTALGQALVNEIAPRRWRAEVTLATMPQALAAELQAMAEAIGPSNPFYLHNHSLPGPRLDRTGAILGAADVTIHTLGSDNRSLRLQGLPAAYVLSAGDLVSVDYGSSPVRRAMFRVAETVTASGGGLTPAFEVRPFLKNGMAVGQTATLIRASAKVIFEPGSFNPGRAVPLITGGMSFTAIEVR